MKTLFLLLAAAAMAGTAGCVREECPECGSPNDQNPDGVTFTLSIPARQIPSTRSIEDEKGEAVVNDVYLLVFKADGTLVDHKPGTVVSQSDDGDLDYKIKITAELSSNPDACTVAIVANVPNVETLIGTNTDKVEILNALTYGTAGSTAKWNANIDNTDPPAAGTDYTPIPMYGEAFVPAGITAGMTISNVAELTRMLARIDVVLTEEVDFIIKEVYLVNYNTVGYVAPAWEANGVLKSGLPETLTIPTSNVTNTGKSKMQTYTVSELEGGIYTYEAPKNTGAENTTAHINAICLIVWGKRSVDTADTFYRIDFTDGKDAAGKVYPDPAFNHATVGYIPVYRNHLYRFEIDGVDGLGYGSIDDALKYSGVVNNLRTKLHVIHQSGVKNMVYNGQHYLGLGGEEVTLSGEQGYILNVPCITNFPDGWSFDTSKGTGGGIQYVTGSSWLKATKSGDNLVLETLSYNDRADNLIADDRVAYVHVKAGKLTHLIKVTQVEYLLYVGRFGGELIKDESGVWSFTEELWIQAGNESRNVQWALGGTFYETNAIGVADMIDGRWNTFELYNRGGSNLAAAYLCYKKNSGTISDPSDLVWYLPAERQLTAVWVSKTGFYPSTYAPLVALWSSTEENHTLGSQAYMRNLRTGQTNHSHDKYTGFFARCVRELPILF